jgi:hypothetical protein
MERRLCEGQTKNTGYHFLIATAFFQILIRSSVTMVPAQSVKYDSHLSSVEAASPWLSLGYQQRYGHSQTKSQHLFHRPHPHAHHAVPSRARRCLPTSWCNNNLRAWISRPSSVTDPETRHVHAYGRLSPTVANNKTWTIGHSCMAHLTSLPCASVHCHPVRLPARSTWCDMFDGLQKGPRPGFFVIAVLVVGSETLGATCRVLGQES